MNLLYFLVSATAAFIIFLKIFNTLNKSKLQLFIPLQKFTGKFEKKDLYANISAVILVIISFTIKDIFLLNDIVHGVMLGLLISLCSVIFDENLIRKKKS